MGIVVKRPDGSVMLQEYGRDLIIFRKIDGNEVLEDATGRQFPLADVKALIERFELTDLPEGWTEGWWTEGEGAGAVAPAPFDLKVFRDRVSGDFAAILEKAVEIRQVQRYLASKSCK